MINRPASTDSLIAVLAAGVLLNYVDRANLATAAPLLQGELSLSASQLGLLLSSFFWVYAPAQILAGWLVHHRHRGGGRPPTPTTPPCIRVRGSGACGLSFVR